MKSKCSYNSSKPNNECLQLGGKGANLAEMCRIGLNVPPGFTITTESCAGFHAGGGQNLSEDVWQDVLASLHRVEDKMGRMFADTQDPLLLSVRSGAAVRVYTPSLRDFYHLSESCRKLKKCVLSAQYESCPCFRPILESEMHQKIRRPNCFGRRNCFLQLCRFRCLE